MLLALAACSSQPDQVRLQDIASNLEYWDGRTVTVDAWLGECEGYTCYVVPTKSELPRPQLCSGTDCDDAMITSEPLIVSVGYDAEFDEEALPLVGRRVLIEGTVDASSWRVPDIDRGEAIRPLSIQLHPDQTES